MTHRLCRTQPDQDARPDPPCVTAVSEDVAAPSASTSLDAADETAPKGEDGGAESKADVEQEVVEEDKDKEEKVVVVVKVKKEVEEEEKKEVAVKEEEEKEVRGTPSGDGSDAESREASGKEEQPAGKSPGGVEGDGFAASGEEVLADGGLGNRLVCRHLFLFCFGGVSEFTHITSLLRERMRRGIVSKKKNRKTPQCHR